MTRRGAASTVLVMTDEATPERDPTGDEPPAIEPAPGAGYAKPPRSSFRWVVVLGTLFVSSWMCCGVVGLRSCVGMAPGSGQQTAARAAAQQYLDAVEAHEWVRVYELSDPISQAAQPLEVQERVFASHPELFDFDEASFEGFNYFANMAGGDHMRLTGRLTGRSSARRTFRLEMQEQEDGRWRVREFFVNLELGSEPTAAPGEPGGMSTAPTDG